MSSRTYHPKIPFAAIRHGRAPRYSGLAFALACGIAHTGAAHAQAAPPPGDSQEVQRRLSREIERTQDAVEQKSVVLKGSAARKHAAFTPPQETPCAMVTDVGWSGILPFSWLPGTVSPRGMCLGPNGLKELQRYLTGQLIERGYVTSTVLMPEQDPANGRLIIKVIPGRVGKLIDKATGQPLQARNALPFREGDVLNLRDLDQALENVRRTPGQAGATFTLTPGAEVGTSDITLDRKRSKDRWHTVLTADNGGQDATGQNQLGLIGIVDAPLDRDDLLLLTYSNNMNVGNDRQASRGLGLNWSMPVGYWNVSLAANSSYAKQSFELLQGGHIAYTSKTNLAQLGVDRVVNRSSHGRGTVKLQLSRRSDSSELGGEQLAVQRRDITSYGLSYDYLHFIGRASLQANIGVRGSLPGLSARSGYVVGRPTWNGSYRLGSASVAINAPFTIGGQRFTYEGNLSGQHAFTPLPWTEYLSINSRYAVRGFDGRYVFTGENGWVAHNNVVWNSGGKLGNPYLGVDAARLSGPSLAAKGSQSFSSVSLGLRGQVARFGYDVSVGHALSKPAAVPDGGFNVSLRMTARF
ncbi:ShlB/FhaC/HecB family hemolysin secretion/activation protein [Dyella sp. 2RAB6]|uniref:ShlB/FhaC/HecB family hemolysin secretion/activation protein n=1 Tax=Dyella sp. 2RAB6 TaxID=3232992 RepID=UPI003F926F50